MKTARIIASIAIIGLFGFLVGILPDLLIPNGLIDSWPGKAMAMFIVMYEGYGLLAFWLTALLLIHIWKSGGSYEDRRS